MNETRPPPGYACGTGGSTYSSARAELVRALRVDGTIVHISQVRRGLQCECTCPGCGSRVIARKGLLLEHHFAHYRAATCSHGPETALHKLAKQLLEKAKRICIPPVEAEQDGVRVRKHNGGDFLFDSVAVEQRRGSIIADLIACTGTRELIIEVRVTHACDERKRQRIRELGISAIEIDLSGWLRADDAEIEEAILITAPRFWLFNPLVDTAQLEARQKAEEREARKAKALQRRVDALAAALRQAETDSARRATAATEAAIKRVTAQGYARAIGVELSGQGCFAVAAEQWQAVIFDLYVLRKLVNASYRHVPIDTDAVYKSAVQESLVGQRFQSFISDELQEALREAGIDFQRPYKTVRAYLEHLAQEDYLQQSYHGWDVSYRLVSQWEKRERDRKVAAERHGIVLEQVTDILNRIPEAERDGLSAEAWLKLPCEAFGISFAEAIRRDDPRYRDMRAALHAVDRMLGGGSIVEDLLGLPIAREAERQRHERAREEEERQKAEAERKRARLERQLSEFSEKVRAALGAAAEAWLSASNGHLEGRTPLEALLENPWEHGPAYRALHDEAERLRRAQLHAAVQAQAEREKQRRIDNWRTRLTETVHDQSRPGDMADLFLNSTQPRLRARPSEYCKDERTYNECMALFQQQANRRR